MPQPHIFDTYRYPQNKTVGLFKNSGVNVFKVGISGEVVLKPLTKEQRKAIKPEQGMIISQSDNNPGLRYFDGTNWIRFSGIVD
jgi:hypothetical protein